MKPIRGFYKKPEKPTPTTLGASIDSLVKQNKDIENLKKNVEKTVEAKIEEIDTIVKSGIRKIDQAISMAESKAVEMIHSIQKIPKLQGKDGKDAEQINYDSIVKSVFGKMPAPEIPVVDENSIARKVLKQLPENKASLKIIQETFETDPMDMLGKILALPDGKFKLKTSHIDGLDQTITAFKNQVRAGVGYVHGGGDTVVAGTNITIVKLPNGTTQINSTGGGGGTVSSVSVVSANGFSGTVATSTTTPAITLSTTITGLLKGNGTAILAAIGDTDYQNPITLTTTGTSGAATFIGDTLNIPQYAGTTYTAGTGLTLSGTSFSVNTSQNISTLSNLTSNGLIKTSGSSGALSIATAGTDYQAPITLTTIGTSGATTFISNTLNIPNYTYTLPTATTSVLGGVKVDGTSITISGGVISAISGGSGTVTSVSVTTANGISGTVATATTTPAITLTLGAITPTSVNGVTFSGSGSLANSGTSNLTGFTGSGTSSGTNTGDQTITLTGDVIGSGTGSFATTLATVNTNTGSWGTATQSPQFTVNGKGLITAATNVTITPAVTSITGLASGMATFLATPTSANLATAVTDETGSGALVFGTAPTISLASASTATTQSPGDGSTKIATTAYVDAAINGTDAKDACKYASTAALPSIVYANGSSGIGATLTGVTLAAISLDSSSPSVGDRVLIKNQVSTFQNGIYTVTATGSGVAVFVLTRTTDFDQSADIDIGDSVFITAGTVNTNTTWVQNGTNNPIIGTDPITFSQIAGPGAITSGNGITVTGLSVAIDTSVTVDKTTAQTLTNKDLTSGTNTFPTFNQNTTGSAATLTTPRTINGVNFDGSAAITVTAAAGTLTGTVLNSTVVTSSLTSVGTLGVLTVTGNITNSALTASKIVFTNASNNLTSTGIGTSSQFIKADGSLDSSTYLTSTGAVTSITGTANQVIASAATGAVTLSLPQSIATTSTPQFARIGLGAAADANKPLYVTGDVSGGTALIERSNATTSAVVGTIIIQGKSTGVAATGFGTAFQFGLADSGTAQVLTGNIRMFLNGGTLASAPTVDMDFNIMFGGLLITPMTFRGDGRVNFTQPAYSGGNDSHMVFTAGAHTNQTASTEEVDYNFAMNRTVQFATGALATQRAFLLQAPTYGFVAASTLTTAATLAITGAPIQGTNATITNRLALWIQNADALQLGTAGSSTGKMNFAGTTSGVTVLTGNTTASGTLTLPAATDTLIGKATTDILTNKTFNTAATGNSFSINGTAITAVNGTGAVVLTTSPALITPALGTPASGVMTNVTGTAAGLTSGITQALASATTTVNVSSATAPSSGQVLTATSSTAATWQIPGGTPTSKIESVYETLGRFIITNSSGATTLGNAGAQMTTTATSGGTTQIAFQNAGNGNTAYMQPGVIYSTNFSIAALGATGTFYTGLGLPTLAGSGITFTPAHIGFKVTTASSIPTLFGTVSDGSTESTTSFGSINSGSNSDYTVMFRINASNASVDFWVSQNGAAYTGPQNIATHVPAVGTTSVAVWVNQLTNDSTGSTQTYKIESTSYEH